MSAGLDSRHAVRKVGVHIVAQCKRPSGSVIKSGVVILQPFFPLTFQEFTIVPDLKGENGFNKISIRLVKRYNEGPFREIYPLHRFPISTRDVAKLKTFLGHFNFNTLKSERRGKFLKSAYVIIRYKQERLPPFPAADFLWL